MPKLISQLAVKVEWSDLAKWRQVKLPKSANRRSNGVHLSSIIRHVLTKLGKLTPQDETDEMPLRMCVGMAWENWVVGLMGDEFCWQPGEWERDGVFGTPDGYTCDYDLGGWIDEFKATWKSEHTHKDILKESIWMWQLAGNCHAASTTRACLHVLWVCGDYRPPSPKYCKYLIRFEQKELDEFWHSIVLKYRDTAPKEEH